MAPEAVRASLIIAAAVAGAAFVAVLALVLFVTVVGAGDDEQPLAQPFVWALHGTTLAATGAGAVACLLAWRRRRTAGAKAPASTAAKVVLAGAVLHAASVPMYALYGVWPGLMSLLPEEGTSPWVPVLSLAIFVALAAVPAAGAAMAFVAYGQARRGAGRPKMLAIVSSLLPPLQVVTLLGALLMRRVTKP